MSIEDQIQFHSSRAATERELAERASSSSAARAHRGLSALHLDRLNALGASDALRSLPHN